METTSDDIAFLMPGVFEYDSDYGDKPYYINSEKDLHLYYEDVDCHAWVLGPELGATSGLVYAQSSAINPARVSAWQGNAVDGSGWAALSGFSLKCTDDSVPVDSLLMGTTIAP